MNHPAALLDRLDAIGRALAHDDDALALIGLGSVGRELDRLDEFSDLDFFVVVRPGAKERFLTELDWLEAARPGAAHYTPGRIIWKRDGVSTELAVPARAPASPSTPPVEQLLGEMLCNLHVGLLRWRRGERQAAAREIQLYAVDRLLELAAHLEPEQATARDPFARMRRFEQRFPQMAAHLPAFQQGYDHTPQSAAAILDFLAARFPLNEAMVAAIRELL